MISLLHALLYDVDWAGTSTASLTIITAYYAWSTRQLLRMAARQATAAEKTVEMLLNERRRQVEQWRAPIADVIRRGIQTAERWLALATDEMNHLSEIPDSRELEIEELPQFVTQMRSLYFPASQALAIVENCIIDARAVIDEVAHGGAESAGGALEEAKVAIERLQQALRAADEELHRWE